jgi:hypothetical protein
VPRTRIDKQPRRSWNAESIKILRRFYADGVPTEAIAEWFGVTVNAIRQQASKAGIHRSAEYLRKVRRAAKAKK